MAMPPPPRPPLLQRLARWVNGGNSPPRRPIMVRSTYAAARVDRLTEGWTTVNSSANNAIHGSIDALRARARQLAQDNDYARKFLQLVDANVIGAHGMAYQARVILDNGRTTDTIANAALEAAWARWSARGVCDVTGRMGLRDLCRVLIKAAARDGEFLVRIVRGTEARNPFGLALQVLDVDRIETTANRTAGEGVNAIRMGVELDQWGRCVALHLKSRHPGDTYQAIRLDDSNSRTIRVPAEDVIHGFVVDRPEQVRGVPWMHAAMLRLQNLGGYEEAAIIASRVGASKMGFFTTEDGSAVPLADGTDPVTQAPVTDADPGTFEALPPGTSFTPFNPDYPSNMFAEFVKANLRGIASGLGVSYHALANDLERVSFSSIRSGTLEERDQWSVIQQWFVEAFLEPIFAEWLRNALAFGQVTLPSGNSLPLSRIERFTPHHFQPRRWDWVDPLRDIQADIAAMDAGLKSPQSIAQRMGQDYEDILQQIAEADRLRASLGLPPRTPRPAPTVAPEPTSSE